MARFWRRRHDDGDEPDDPKAVPIADAPARARVRVRGEVVQMRTRPVHGLPSLSITIRDDSGTATIVFAGRREIGGIALGRRLVIEGVAVDSNGTLEFTNPAYTLLSP
jgi:RecG-like helicase